MSDDQVRPLLPAISATQLRANPFRVLGLAADASAAQVRRQAERVAAAHRLGAAQAAPGVLPPATAPDEAALREAAHRLRDPQARLLSELLWFSPDPGPEPARWPLDGSAPVPELLATWASAARATAPTPTSRAAAHNLAVLPLIDLADAGLDPQQRPAGGDRARGDVALTAWARWLATPGTVDEVCERARTLGAGAIADADHTQVRDAVAAAVLAACIELTCAQLDQGRAVGSEVVAGLVEGGLPVRPAQTALRDLVERADVRVRSLCEAAWAAAQADRDQAPSTGERLQQDARPWLNLLVEAGSAGPPGGAVTATRTADKVADVLTACAVNFVDNGDLDQLTAARPLVAAAREIARGEQMRSGLTETLADLDQAIENARAARQPPRCLICSRDASDPGSHIPVQMVFGKRADDPPHGREILLGMPRCPSCSARRASARTKEHLLAAHLFVTIAACVLAAQVPVLWLLAVPVALSLVFSIRDVLTTRRQLAAVVLAHPSVLELKGLGYRLGDNWQDARWANR